MTIRRTAIIGIMAVAAALAGWKLVQHAKSADPKPEIYQSGHSDDGQKLALGGYDAVAYHKQNKALEGSDEYVFVWSNATWRFASSENRTEFQNNPEKYAPQYGGYCAYGVAQGYAVHGDPKAWRIINGRLFLNYNKEVQQTWNEAPETYITEADANWPDALNR